MGVARGGRAAVAAGGSASLRGDAPRSAHCAAAAAPARAGTAAAHAMDPAAPPLAAALSVWRRGWHGVLRWPGVRIARLLGAGRRRRARAPGRVRGHCAARRRRRACPLDRRHRRHRTDGPGDRPPRSCRPVAGASRARAPPARAGRRHRACCPRRWPASGQLCSPATTPARPRSSAGHDGARRAAARSAPPRAQCAGATRGAGRPASSVRPRRSA